MTTLTIGTRGSALARAQTRWVEEQILAFFPGTIIQTQIITTSADRDTVTSIRSGSDTGVFVREIEEALLAGHIDLAVHSMKDLPTRIPEGLEIGAIPVREDARDALIAGPECHSLADLPIGAVLGTGSVRRQAQILARRPDLIAKDIRGNVQTRLKKLASGDYEAIVLACAGLNRLGLGGRISARFEFPDMLPAPGQGALALEMRKGDRPVAGLIGTLHDPAVASAVLAERAFLRRMGGGCNSPIAVHARPADGAYIIEGLVASPDGVVIVRDQVRAAAPDVVAAADALAEKILAAGGSAILESLR
jgi:hydroxymethylbilane synthase